MKSYEIISHFNVPGWLVGVSPIGSGNINDTFRGVFRTTCAEYQVILQRINRAVFREPEIIMSNLRLFSDHAHKFISDEIDFGRADRIWQMPKIISTKDGKDFFIDPETGDFWRCITKIPSAKTYDEPQSAEHAAECGAVLAHFHAISSSMPKDSLKNPLPGFHITPLYLAQYDKTIETDAAQRVLSSSIETRRLAIFIEERRNFVSVLQNAVERGELTPTFMHGDPKINNIMIDEFSGKGTAMIDLDTISPGLIHYDFGDAVRSICNPAGEEELELSKVNFNTDYCESFANGYLAQAKGFLTDTSRKYLFDAVRLITFELGLRFFQDYLAGNVYFKTKSPEQNLNRARVQFKLCTSIESKEAIIRRIFEAS